MGINDARSCAIDVVPSVGARVPVQPCHRRRRQHHAQVVIEHPGGRAGSHQDGHIKNVVPIAGYVPDANNQLCVVVAMINSDLVGNGLAIVDALIEWVAKSDRTPVVVGQ